MSEEQATYLCSLSAQELRIGNWVYDGERTQFPMQVVAIGKDWALLDFPGNEGGALSCILSATAKLHNSSCANL